MDMKKNEKRGDKGDSSPSCVSKPSSTSGIPAINRPSRISSNHQLAFAQNKASPLKSALDELEENINGVNSINVNLERDLKQAGEKAFTVMEACESEFLQQLSRLQDDVITQCRLAEVALQEEYSAAMEKIIQKKQIQHIPKMGDSDEENLVTLNSDFYITASMSGIDEELKSFKAKGLMEEGDFKSIIGSLKQLMETTANTGDCKLLTVMLIKLENDFTPRSELSKAEVVLDEIKCKIVPKATFFTLQRSLESLKDKWKTVIEDNKKIYNFRESLLNFEKAIRCVDNKYKKLESGLNIFAAESCLRKTPLQTIKEVLDASFEEYLANDLMKNETFREVSQNTSQLNDRLKHLDLNFASEDELQSIVRTMKSKTVAQEDVRRFSNRIRDVETTLSKFLCRNIEDDFSKINNLLKSSNSNKAVGTLVKSAQDKITELGAEVEKTLATKKHSIQASLSKQLEGMKATILDECLPFAKDRVVACFEALRNDLDLSGYPGSGMLRTDEVMEGLRVEKEKLMKVFEDKLQEFSRGIKGKMDQQLTRLSSDVKAQCEDIQKNYKEDYKFLCNSIQDDLNENLQNANGNLLSNFQTLLEGCDSFHATLRREVEEMLEVVNQEVIHLKNLKTLASDGLAAAQMDAAGVA